jgi:hypothetical protein
MSKDYTHQLILKICSQPRSLDYIAEHLNGIDPITALGILKEMEKQEFVRCNEGLWLIEQKAKKDIGDLLNPDNQLYLKKFMGDFDFFKKPHPLDAEWRNTKRSVKYLSELVLTSSHSEEKILILGMPTLFANLCKMDVPQKITIIERNTGVTNTLKEFSHQTCKVIEADIFKVDPDKIGAFSTVVMDPPWYEEHFYQFVWLANRCLELGGRLIISIPPLNTRPGIGKQRIEWFKFCLDQGLCLQNLYAGKLEYTTPFFEWNAHRTAGVCASPIWRHGDLAIFEKMILSEIKRPDHKEDSDNWKEVEIDSCRIRVRIDDQSVNSENESFSAKPLVGNQILPSVSSRDPRRAKANIFTSGNRVFHTNCPVKLYTHLQYYRGKIPVSSEESKEIFDFISFVTQSEHSEYNEYLEWIYNEMERDHIPLL